MSNLTWIETIYWVSTLIGGTFFILRTIMLVVGGFDDIDTDFDADLDADIDFDGDLDADLDTDLDADADFGHSETLTSFKLLTIQGLTAFFMMFGLVGLALYHANLAVGLTILGGTAAGLFTVWVISVLFSQMKLLQSEGTIDIKNAIGQTGSVYLAIAEGGSGQVQVTVQGALKIFNAAARNKKPIATGEKVTVVDVVGSDTLIVEKSK